MTASSKAGLFVSALSTSTPRQADPAPLHHRGVRTVDPADSDGAAGRPRCGPGRRDQISCSFSRDPARLLTVPPSVTYDTLPAGEVAVHGGDHVHATDGNIGRIQGLVIDSASRQVTHVLLQEGHVFGRKIVAIPIGAVTGVGKNGIQLGITKQQVKDLPSGWHRSPR